MARWNIPLGSARSGSSASINDVPVSAALLREIGDMLVEIQGQFEGRGLLDVSTHLGHIDRAADHDEILTKLAGCWDNWLPAQRNLAEAKRDLEKARAEEDWLRDAVEQLDLLAPRPGVRPAQEAPATSRPASESAFPMAAG